MKAAVFKCALALGVAGLLTGCAGIRNHRGYVADPELSAAANVVEPEALARRVFERVERQRQREQAQQSGFPIV